MELRKFPKKIQTRLVLGVLKRTNRPLTCAEILKRDGRIDVGALHNIVGQYADMGDDKLIKLVRYQSVDGRSQGVYAITERGRMELEAMRRDEPNLRKAYAASRTGP